MVWGSLKSYILYSAEGEGRSDVFAVFVDAKYMVSCRYQIAKQ